MIVGFTGTRNGLSKEQRIALEGKFQSRKIDALHHGCCVGADEEANGIARECGIKTIGHPPLNTRLMSMCRVDELRPPLDYLDRNQEIVKECDILIACPGTMKPIQRSGTWFTIRHAEQVGRPTIVIFPDGSRKIHHNI